MSYRSDIASRLAHYIKMRNLNQPYGGVVENAGSHLAVHFSRGLLQGRVEVHEPCRLIIRHAGEGPARELQFGSEQDALDYIRFSFVESRQEWAERIPSLQLNIQAATLTNSPQEDRSRFPT